VQARQIERYGNALAIDFSENAVLVWMPFRKRGQVVPNLRAVRVEQVGPILMDHHPVLVKAVVCISSDMTAPIDDENPPVELAGQSLSQNSACEPCTHD
jgi:hypothetical protein